MGLSRQLKKGGSQVDLTYYNMGSDSLNIKYGRTTEPIFLKIFILNEWHSRRQLEDWYYFQIRLNIIIKAKTYLEIQEIANTDLLGIKLIHWYYIKSRHLASSNLYFLFLELPHTFLVDILNAGKIQQNTPNNWNTDNEYKITKLIKLIQ